MLAQREGELHTKWEALNDEYNRRQESAHGDTYSLHSSQVAQLYRVQIEEKLAKFCVLQSGVMVKHIRSVLAVWASDCAAAMAEVHRICEQALDFVLEMSKLYRLAALKLLIAVLHATDHSFFICVGRWYVRYALKAPAMRRLFVTETKAKIHTSNRQPYFDV